MERPLVDRFDRREHLVAIEEAERTARRGAAHRSRPLGGDRRGLELARHPEAVSLVDQRLAGAQAHEREVALGRVVDEPPHQGRRHATPAIRGQHTHSRHRAGGQPAPTRHDGVDDELAHGADAGGAIPRSEGRRLLPARCGLRPALVIARWEQQRLRHRLGQGAVVGGAAGPDLERRHVAPIGRSERRYSTSVAGVSAYMSKVVLIPLSCHPWRS